MNWVSCKQCQKQNTLDGLFCRRCGHALDEQELQVARTENEQLLNEGFKFLSDQRFDEAYETAKIVLEVDPSLGHAYSLMGDILERKGDFNGAIIAFEKVLQDNPSSTLDQIKLNHVRGLLQAQSIPTKPVKSNKSRALLLATATTLLIGSLGAAAVIYFDRDNKAGNGETLVADGRTDINNGGYATYGGEKIDMNSVIRPNQNNEILTSGNPSGATQPQMQTQSPTPQNTNPQNNQANNLSASSRPSNLNGQLPSTNSDNEVLRPMGLNVIPDRETLPPRATNNPPVNQAGPNQPANQDPDPTPTTSNQQPNNPSAGNASVTGGNTRPVIDIRPSPGSRQGASGGGQAVQPQAGNSVKDLIAEARKQYILNNYSEAAKLYEEALRRGAEAGVTNQRLGNCYERLGKRSEARRCYEKAVEVFEKRIEAGDTSSSTKAGLEATRQALKAL